MCTMVYLASDRPLPRIEWNEEHPGFHTELLSESDDAAKASAVRSRFSKPIVYRLGSNQRCGCGFAFFEQFEGGDYEPSELEAAAKSRESLAAYLTEALKHQESLEILICWAGDEGCETEGTLEVRPEDLLDPERFQQEKVLLTVKSLEG